MIQTTQHMLPILPNTTGLESMETHNQCCHRCLNSVN
ncbi:unnamed protein product [Medioppia subpectinata]|uniref:Uncharacterized protein n=1 Tax=Medioppia subpectinata TaxID=1979941 RepID=A0A7R9LZC7_9ACAR|nr:unnamed protein product [Medioppia subpectinata]CAG2123058.1 unnamed protein product [Medioppia subpectinata]